MTEQAESLSQNQDLKENEANDGLPDIIDGGILMFKMLAFSSGIGRVENMFLICFI